MPTLIEKATGKPWEVPDSELAAAQASGLYEPLASGTTVTVVDPGTGLPGSVAAQDLAAYQDQGLQAETDSGFRVRERGARIEREHGGVLGGVAAGATSLVDSAFLGLPGAAVRAVAPDLAETIREQQEAHPVTSGVASVAGVVAPALLTGGTSAAAGVAAKTGAGAATRLGAGVAERLGGGILAKGAGAAVEGGLLGAGQGLQELVAAEDPITIERLASALGSNALLGAVTSGAITAGGTAAVKGARTVAKGLAKSRELVDGAKVAASASGAGDDLAAIAGDRKALLAKRNEHLDELVTTQKTEVATRKAAVVDEVAKQRRAVAESDAWLLVDDQKARARLSGSERTVEKLLDTPLALKDNPGALLKPLEKGLHVLEETAAKADELAAKLAAEDSRLARELGEELATLPDGAASVRVSGKTAVRFGDRAGKPVAKKVAAEGIEITRDQAADLFRALETGEVQGARKAALERLPQVLEQRRALYQQVKLALEPGKARGELFSDRLAAIDDLLTAPAPSAKKGLLEQMAQGSIYGAAVAAMPAMPLGGVLAPLLGAKVASAVTGLVFGRGAKAVAGQAERTSRAVAAFVETGKRLAPAAPPLATKVLTSVAYAPPPAKGEAAPEPATKSPPLVAAYRKREAEIYSQVAAGPDGKIVMRPEARAKVAERLGPVHVLSPKLADSLETQAARRIEFLATKLPKRPDFAAVLLGPDRWQPSKLEMRRFARYCAAAEDPGGIEERLADGTLSPEDAETYREVFPERLADFKRQIMERLAEVKAEMPYPRKLALSMLFGTPLVPALVPEILRVIQGQYASEPGTEGGTQAPKAAPQFGSVKADKTTPAQERAT